MRWNEVRLPFGVCVFQCNQTEQRYLMIFFPYFSLQSNPSFCSRSLSASYLFHPSIHLSNFKQVFFLRNITLQVTTTTNPIHKKKNLHYISHLFCLLSPNSSTSSITLYIPISLFRFLLIPSHHISPFHFHPTHHTHPHHLKCRSFLFSCF